MKVMVLYFFLAMGSAFAEETSPSTAMPTIVPCRGYYVKGYGIEAGNQKMHEGLDIEAKVGTEVRATADGTVSRISGTKDSRTIEIRHGIDLSTFYDGLAKTRLKTGQMVKQGAVIGALGRSGRLHYEVRVRGVPVDPLAYIIEKSEP